MKNVDHPQKDEKLSLTSLPDALSSLTFTFLGSSIFRVSTNVKIVSKNFLNLINKHQETETKKATDIGWFSFIEQNHILKDFRTMHFLIKNFEKGFKTKPTTTTPNPVSDPKISKINLRASEDYCLHALWVSIKEIDYETFLSSFLAVSSEKSLTPEMKRALEIIGLFKERHYCLNENFQFMKKKVNFIKLLSPEEKLLSNRCGEIRAKIDKSITQRLCVKTTSFINLSGADFSHGVFYLEGSRTYGVNLTGAMMRHARCFRTIFPHANFTFTKLEDTTFYGVEFGSIKLSRIAYNQNTEFKDCTFEGAVIENIDFTELNISECSFAHVFSMKNCLFSKSQLKDLKIPLMKCRHVKQDIHFLIKSYTYKPDDQCQFDCRIL